MYWRRMAIGSAPMTSIEPRLRIKGERMSRFGLGRGRTPMRPIPPPARGSEQPADDLALAVQGGEPLLQSPGEPQKAIDFEQLVADQTAGMGGDCVIDAARDDMT